MKKIALLCGLIVIQSLCQAMDNQTTIEGSPKKAVQAYATKQGICQKMKAAWKQVPTEAKVIGGTCVGVAAVVGGFIYLLAQKNETAKQKMIKRYHNFLDAEKQLALLHDVFSKKWDYYEESAEELKIKAGEAITKDHPYFAIVLDVLHALYGQLLLPITKESSSNRDRLQELSLTLQVFEFAIRECGSWYFGIPECVKSLIESDISPEIAIRNRIQNSYSMLIKLEGFTKMAAIALDMLEQLNQNK